MRTEAQTRRMILMELYRYQQEVYEWHWVHNAWGFGKDMVAYLKSPYRRIRHGK